MITDKEIIQRLVKRINKSLAKDRQLTAYTTETKSVVIGEYVDMLYFDTEEQIIAFLQGVEKGLEIKQACETK